MANENSKTPIQAQPQMIPLSKIHDLPNVFIAKPQDKSLGSMVLSIESSGIKEAVILRQRDDGEYQLLSGYRRRRASELAKKQDIPAHVYEMTMQEAIAYRKAVKNNPNAPIPGKLLDPSADKDKGKGTEAPAAPGDKAKEGEAPAAPGEKPKEDKAPAAPGEKPKEDKAPAAPGEKQAPTAGKPTPTVAELEAQAKSGQPILLTDLANAERAEREAQKGGEAPGKGKPDQSAVPDKDTGEALTTAKEGPSGTSITQIFDKRLAPPDEASRKTLPTPKEGESYFITLHPAYLEKSVFNNFSVDTESENFKELLKSVELVGIKDPVLARFNPEGRLEILSGQRRHIAATMLNQAVPTIIQKIDGCGRNIRAEAQDAGGRSAPA